MSIKSLMEERAKVWDSMTAVREAATAEKREFTAEERENWDKAEARLTTLTGDIEREQRADEFAKTLAPKMEQVADEIAANRTEDKPAEYREVFEKWARFGSGEMTNDEKRALRDGFVAASGETRALGIGTGAAGGYAVPQGFRDVLIETLKYYNSVRQVATVITTDSGATLPWPTNNDTANVGAILAENSQITQQDVTLGQEQLSAYMYTSKLVLVSLQLLQDSAINVESFLARKLGQRIGRIQNQHFTTGSGTGQPLGLVTGGTLVSQAATGSTTAIKYADLVNTMFKVDPAYRNGGNVKWMWSDTALSTIRQLVDGQGRPLWEPSVQAGTPDILLGKPVIINNDLAVPAANAKTGAFGDFEAGYVIRDVSGVQTVRLDERYADFLQVGWFAYCRTDATVQDTAAYTVFQQSAT
ncbi:MAG: phage major capsid protein [Mycobacteriaceae bacterium]